MTETVFQYLRFDDRFPTVWCPGCSLGTVMRSIIEAVIALKLKQDDVAVVSGIGCASRMSGYMDFNTLHVMHGRALPAATAVKMSRPDMKVIAIMGDGDALAIGGNHLIHAARRNLDVTAIIVNNSIYAMTGGQVSPATPAEVITTTSPFGNLERQFDICGLMKAAGAVLFVRATVSHVFQCIQLIRRAIEKKGFSVVEVMSNCPVIFGKLTRAGGPVEMLARMKERTIPVERAREMTPQELVDRIITGVLFESGAEEYGETCIRKLPAKKEA